TLEVRCRGIETPNGTRIARRLDEGGGLTESLLLVQPRHFLNAEPFGKRDAPVIHVAAGDLVYHFCGGHRAIETELAGLQRAGAAAAPQGGAKCRLIADDAGLNQALADRARAASQLDRDELL